MRHLNKGEHHPAEKEKYRCAGLEYSVRFNHLRHRNLVESFDGVVESLVDDINTKQSDEKESVNMLS